MSNNYKGKGGWEDPEADGFQDNPFAALRRASDIAASDHEAGDTEVSATVEMSWADEEPDTALLRLERKGRGGKEVTVVEQLGLSPLALEKLCHDLRRQLGVGGSVEPPDIVLQGDQRDRLAALLTARGVRNVRSC